ncbi:SMP-30/gluconolactonase/LRE family protein [Caballeronia novacaledonica]|uniref:SMP-30/gluconolactonase/LRE family protein n=1 Tax=Caballeronia novacaledonica TaxID=1544861 RepID=A0AA37IGI7_9BURK|nr:SMP-30/gluconolactonase/LRE family protein [Caballeronia novacaledonica]GJH29406.1 SMP-30/gluconolactonase/LRE family protein [Caballeronia novacaledonica]
MSERDFLELDERFNRCVRRSEKVQQLFTGCRWAEGPVYVPAGRYLLWSDIPNDRVLRWDETDGTVSVFLSPSNFANGHSLDREGRVVRCEHGSRSVTRTEHDGSVTTLGSHYQGKRLNSPNDVIVKSDGSIWFTDPAYGIDDDFEGHAAPSEIGACHVYRIDAHTGACTIVADNFVRPNGLAFSPDEKLLYIVDSGVTHVKNGARHFRVFEVHGRELRGGEVFATCTDGMFDGFRLDDAGRLWAGAADGVHCYHPDGTLLGKILTPEPVANVAFGGPQNNQLFICATTSLYAVRLPVTGARRPAALSENESSGSTP